MYEVQIETYENPLEPDPFISTTFRGGSGQIYTQSMDVLVIRSENSIEFESISYTQVGTAKADPCQTSQQVKPKPPPIVLRKPGKYRNMRDDPGFYR